MAQKPWIPTPEILEQIKEMVQEGMSQEDIARCVGCSGTTFFAKKKDYPEIEEAIQEAKAALHKRVTSLLMKKVFDEKHPNHYQALIFYISKQMWRDNVVHASAEKMLPSGLDFVDIPPPPEEE